MQGIKVKYYLMVLVLTAFSGLGGCFKTDNPPQLEIQVIDASGNPVSGVFVGLFDTYDNWKLRENPVQTWRQTNADGYVLFIDLREIDYYFYARIDSRDNSYREIKTEWRLKINERARVKVHLD